MAGIVGGGHLPDAGASGNHRAFTMLEMMLAVVIGAIVMSVAMSLFMSLDASQRRLERRFEAALGLGRARLAASRAMEQLLMSDEPRPAELDEEENFEDFMRDGGASMASARARFILEPDARLPPAMEWQEDPDALPLYIQPQRLEVTLRSAPVYALSAGGDSLALDDPDAIEDLVESMRQPETARRAGMDEGDEDGAEEDEGEEVDQREAPLAPGIRGVFEITPDEGAEEMLGLEPIGWTLWWRVLGNSFETGELDAAIALEERARLHMLLGETVSEVDGEANKVKLAEGLRTIRWTARRDEESLERLVVVWDRDLPAYVELETETLDGRWNKWMFEVSWSTGPEPGTPVTGEEAGETGDEGDEGDSTGEPGDEAPTIGDVPVLEDVFREGGEG